MMQPGNMQSMNDGGGGINPNQNNAEDYKSLGIIHDTAGGDWTDEIYRNKIRQQIDEQLRNVGQLENGKKSIEWENQVFLRSKTREEYIKLVATLILKLRDYHKKQNPRVSAAPTQNPAMPNGCGQRPGMVNQPYHQANQFSPTPINSIINSQIGPQGPAMHLPTGQNIRHPNSGSSQLTNNRMNPVPYPQNSRITNLPQQNPPINTNNSPMSTFNPSPMQPVPSPSSVHSMPNAQQTGQVPINNSQNVISTPTDEYVEKLKTLRKYIEPLTRIILKQEQEGRSSSLDNKKIQQEMAKMKYLRNIILGNQYVTTNILCRCENVLQQIAPVDLGPRLDEDRSNDQHMCQALLDVVNAHIRKPNINHTLNRTFGAVLEKLRHDPTISSRCICQIEDTKEYFRPREIPSVVQGEVASLNKKFVARLDNSRSHFSGDIHIIVCINDTELPPVKDLKITIPVGYPAIPPIIKNEKYEIDGSGSDGMEMAEYDEEEDFLKIQEAFFEERLESLGPDLVTLTQILSSWELSIRQALAKMNITYAKQRHMVM